MIRSLRRDLRAWKRQLAAFWGRFNTVYRIVIGVALAAGLVYAARAWLFLPMQEDLRLLTERLQTAGAPGRIPDAASDSEILNNQMSTADMRLRLEELRDKVQTLEATSPLRLDATVSDAMERILDLASKHRLHVQENRDIDPFSPRDEDRAPVDSPDGDLPNTPTRRIAAPPVPLVAKQFELRGEFQAVRSFLEEVKDVQLLWEITGTSIRVLQNDHGEPHLMPGGSPMLALRFRMTLYLYEREGS